MAHLYDVGTRAWQPDPTEGWVASEVEEKIVHGDKVKLIFRLVNGEVACIARTSLLHGLTRQIYTGEDNRHHVDRPRR